MRISKSQDPLASTSVGNPAKPPPAPTALTLSTGLTLPVPAPRVGLTGRHDGLASAAYNDDPALRHTAFKPILQSPLHFRTALEEPDEDSAARTWGRVFHTLALEPELEKETVVVVEASTRNTNIYKAEAAKSSGKDLVLRHEYDDIRRAVDRFSADYLIQELLRDAAREVSLFWKDQQTGLALKARPDVLGEYRLIDIKTTSSMRYFARDARDYGYFNQVAWYVAGAQAVGRPVMACYIIAVEKTAPFAPKVFALAWQRLDQAAKENQAGLQTLKGCLEANYWPGYAQIEDLA